MKKLVDIAIRSFILGSIFLIPLLMSSELKAEDLHKIVQLSGTWRFSIGDRSSWAGANFNDSEWDEIQVPGQWENYGYNDYNGYAWYRKRFKMPDYSYESPIYLVIGRIDDTDEIYLNGKRLAGSGKFPPDYVTAYNLRRKYLVPREYLNFNGVNTIAVRVYDSYREGGIINGPVGLYTDEDYAFLDYDLSGKWKFHLGDNKQWKTSNYNDEIWDQISVPYEWEQQGYANYDGYAWYRKDFTVPQNLRKEELYLILGKIDDYDYVYLNGELIGSVFDLDKDGEYKRHGYEYNARRIYRIPAKVLNTNGNNVLAIRVFDGQIRGGIYEGPIGLMTEENVRLYKKRHYSNQNFWDFFIDQFIID